MYDLPVAPGGIVIDAGGYQGEWSIGMVSRYGCRSWIFEPVPMFFQYCQEYFEKNTLVEVRKAALGGEDRKAVFGFFDNGTSEHVVGDSQCFEADVIDVARVFGEIGTSIACLKLNIEGGEYEVLERLLETNHIVLCDSLLIQFHRQPAGYRESYENIVAALQKTHVQVWCYEMVWEKWVRKDIQ